MHRLPHLSRDEFQNYWMNQHPLSAPRNAAELLGIRKYVQVFPIPEEDNKQVKEIRDGADEFDGVAEIWIDDLETFTTKWKTGEGKKAFESFLEDEKKITFIKKNFFIFTNKHIVCI